LFVLRCFKGVHHVQEAQGKVFVLECEMVVDESYAVVNKVDLGLNLEVGTLFVSDKLAMLHQVREELFFKPFHRHIWQHLRHYF
jgi:hypothetical protein